MRSLAAFATAKNQSYNDNCARLGFVFESIAGTGLVAAVTAPPLPSAAGQQQMNKHFRSNNGDRT